MANTRQPDTVHIEGDYGRFDRFTTLQITNDYMQPAEASFEIGDDGTWSSIERAIKLGAKYTVFVNDCLHMTGRVELNDVPIDPSGGAAVRFAVRTKLADAMYASADPKTRIKDVRILDFILELYKPLGLTIDDFVITSPDVARNLMTGQPSKGGGKSPPDMDAMTEDQAKVNPPETIYAAADKHLKRFGLMHWDSPDGKIWIGVPDDTLEPSYTLLCYRGTNSAHNNVLSATHARDASGVPSTLGVFGTTGKDEWTKAKVRSVESVNDLVSAGFYRPVLIMAEAAKTQELARRMAKRELSDRIQRFDSWTVKVDGLSYWSPRGVRFPWGIDTVAQIVTDVAGGDLGNYLITRCVKTRNARDGDTADLTLLKKGLWVL